MGQYTVNLPTPKKSTGKQTVTKVGGQTFISNQPFYETKEGKAALKELQKVFKKTESPTKKLSK